MIMIIFIIIIIIIVIDFSSYNAWDNLSIV
jgi:hypothetical protein